MGKTWSVAALLTAGLLVAGCGSEAADEPVEEVAAESGPTEDAASPTPSEQPSEEPEPAALTTKPFCDRLDAGALASAVGEKGLTLVLQRTVGEKYEPLPGAKKLTADANSCTYVGGSAQFMLSVRPDSSAKAVTSNAMSHKAAEVGSCQVSPGGDAGKPTFLVTCDRNVLDPSGEGARAGVMGRVDGHQFACFASVTGNTSAQKLRGPVVDECGAALEQLRTG